jgi:hypothetical protein
VNLAWGARDIQADKYFHRKRRNRVKRHETFRCLTTTAEHHALPKTEHERESKRRHDETKYFSVPGCAGSESPTVMVITSTSGVIPMRAAEGSKRVLVTMPPQVRRWLEQTAQYNGSTLSGETVRAIRQCMERESIRPQQERERRAAAAE